MALRLELLMIRNAEIAVSSSHSPLQRSSFLTPRMTNSASTSSFEPKFRRFPRLPSNSQPHFEYELRLTCALGTMRSPTSVLLAPDVPERSRPCLPRICASRRSHRTCAETDADDPGQMLRTPSPGPRPKSRSWISRLATSSRICRILAFHPLIFFHFQTNSAPASLREISLRGHVSLLRSVPGCEAEAQRCAPARNRNRCRGSVRRAEIRSA